MIPKSEQAKTESWDLPIQYLKGVGENLARVFHASGLSSYWDLLLFLPRTYEDRRKMWSYAEMLAHYATSPVVMSTGQVIGVNKKGSSYGGKSWLELTVQVWGAQELRDHRIHLIWFQDWGGAIAKKFPEGTRILFRGKLQDFRGQLQISHPDVQTLEKEVPWWEKTPWVPIYKEIGGLSTKVIRKIVALSLERPDFARIPEILPRPLLDKYGFSTLSESLREVHFPTRWTPHPESPRPEGPFYARIVFEELFHMALALHLRRASLKEISQKEGQKVASLALPPTRLAVLESQLPFRLTTGQKTVLSEILGDVSGKADRPPMHRMLQGDVGSGKTIVAFLAALAAMEQNYQVALMAPTEILANQHYQNFCKLFPEASHRAALLKGALKAKEKKAIRVQIESGQILFAIGTQALLTEDTVFENLALVIVDEQHRFGVEQRLTLKQGHQRLSPHLLVMTATPIPRSLALTLYGDLNMSFLREKPAGRKPVATHVVKERARAALQERLKKFLAEGRQIYIVYPLVEESEKLDLKNATAAFAEWEKIFAPVAVGLLHGKMKAKQKEDIMQSFKRGDLRVLVATTVIEVGVDVPNASVMVIEHSERFGLSQLHQLRGRVGRGTLDSFCVLMAPDRTGDIIRERLQLMERSEDGFEIAEKDLEIRGPGEFLGRRQSGMQGFRVAEILRDLKWLEIARDEARLILEKDPTLSLPENRCLREGLERWWLGKLELSLSG